MNIDKATTGIGIAFIILFMGMTAMTFTDAQAGNDDGWSTAIYGKVVDVDPIANGGSVGLFVEVEGKSYNKWFWIWQDDIVGSWPTRGEVGTFLTSKDKKKDKYKWVEEKVHSRTTQSSPASKQKKAPAIVAKSPGWTNATVSKPPVNKTVLVRYKNGKTITTAYVNIKKQWKLETDRERVAGGREISTIAEWRDINE